MAITVPETDASLSRDSWVDEDPAWTLVEPADVAAGESLLTIHTGSLGTRGTREERTGPSGPLVLHAGVYTGVGAEECLLPGPVWTTFDHVLASTADRRVLDLRTGVVTRTVAHPDGRMFRSVRFASAARPGVVALRAEGHAGTFTAGAVLRPPRTEGADSAGELPGTPTRMWARATNLAGGGIAALGVQDSDVRDGDVEATGTRGPLETVQRIAAYVGDALRAPQISGPTALLEAAVATGFDALMAEQRDTWARRWHDVNVEIPDDPHAELAVRYALFQLWNLAGSHDELPVGARGLSGGGYRGHVFWDADIFVLPALASIDPGAAQAMLRYRIRRVDAARARAARDGREGARFPWESATTGADVTPTTAVFGSGTIPILTGLFEEHITADVAWSAVHLATWAGQRSPGAAHADFLVQTARYWESRVRAEPDGTLHIEDVIGPDEYHERVDDNVFTNVMARWNLRAAAAIDQAPGAAHGVERARWRLLADRIVDGYDPTNGRHEQFRGYFTLEPLTLADVARPPVAADLLLGRDRVARSQLIKQPDVLMAHRLVPDELPAGSFAADLNFYGPRTAHGSSLSPSVSAELLARAARADEAQELFRIACTVDLEDTAGNAAAGLHVANLAGLWTAVLAGFAGVSAHDRVISIDPHLPTAWRHLAVRFRCMGQRIHLELTHDAVCVHTDGPVAVHVSGHSTRTIAGTAEFPVVVTALVPLLDAVGGRGQSP